MASRRDRRAPAPTPRRPAPARAAATAVTDTPSAGLARHAALLAVIAVLVVVALVRLRIADVPLERDEGEYAYAGQLILQGIPPYQLAYNMKFPGTYYAYAALLALFGQTAWGIHVGLLAVNALTTLLLFFLGRRLLGAFPAAVGAVAFAVLALDRWIMGVFAHATHFVTLFAVAGFLVLLRAVDSRRALAFLAAGALLGLSVLMKQHALLFVPLGLALAVWHDLRQPAPSLPATAFRGGLLLAGAALPLALVCVVLAAQGVLDRFWFWTFAYAREYASIVPLGLAWQLFGGAVAGIVRSTLAVWLLAGAGLVTLWALPWARESRALLSGLLLASFLAVCPGFYFRPHYFIVMLPAVGLLVGVAVASIDRLLAGVVAPAASRAIAVMVFVAAVATYVVAEGSYLFSLAPHQITRAIYGGNPFVEAVDIARHIRERTRPDERIAVIGSEPEIYFYADRKSATGYIYVYPLVERQRFASRMQAEMMREIEAAHPRYLVFVGISSSWAMQAGADRSIVDWAGRYAQACYEMAGIADVHPSGPTTVLWDDAARAYRPRSPNLVYTYRRKSDAPCAVPP